jgi:hypothetical protein
MEKYWKHLLLHSAPVLCLFIYVWQYISEINDILYKHCMLKGLVCYVTVNTVLGNKWHSADKCAFICGKMCGQNVCPTWQLSRHLLILVCMRVFMCVIYLCNHKVSLVYGLLVVFNAQWLQQSLNPLSNQSIQWTQRLIHNTVNYLRKRFELILGFAYETKSKCNHKHSIPLLQATHRWSHQQQLPIHLGPKIKLSDFKLTPSIKLNYPLNPYFICWRVARSPTWPLSLH